ncbi:DYW deaminase domain-containing protein [Citrus sinensis]|uniref:DYW deaminase domain-containing protein n=1 Tax=Citrus sinensis TaxID=2711 RepID=A0ACB8HV31_CITSI|nr:DYW deaminase domain-containing protein [Citrus sinensis]
MLPRWSRAVRSLNSITQRNDFHAISRQSYAMATAAAASVEPAPRPTKQLVVSLDKMFWSKPASLALAPDSPLRVDEPKYEGIKHFILKLMLFYSKQSKSIRGANVIYKRVVSQVDKPAIYDVFNLEKTFRMTFSLLVLHMWFCLRRLKEEGKEGVELGQYLYGIYNHDVELRVSKAGVNLLLSKWMKELEKIFYGNIVAFDAALLPEAKQDELQNVIWRNIFSDDGSSKPDDAAVRAVQACSQLCFVTTVFCNDEVCPSRNKEAMFSGNFMFTPLENTSFGPSRSSTAVAFHSQTTQKLNVAIKTKFPILTEANEPQRKSQIQPLIDILRDSTNKGSLELAKSVHGFVLKSDFSDKDLLILLNHIAHAYSKCSDFDAAFRVFDKMSQRNIFSWTVMIVGSTENGSFIDGYKFFCQMLNSGVLPDNFAYSAILQTCIGLNCVELGKMVHAQIIIKGFASHTVVTTSLLNMYAKLGRVEDSYKMFNTMTEHNEVSWNAMISGFTSNGLHSEAFDHFLLMKSEGVTPNMLTIIGVSKAVGQLHDVDRGKEVQSFASELGLESNVQVGTALIDMYSKCGSLNDARAVFDSILINSGANVLWNAIISGYSQNGCGQEALELYVRMCQKDIKADVYTYCSVFNAIAVSKYLQLGKAVHGIVLKSGSDVLVVSVYNAIADAYAKCGALEDVRKVFDWMGERDMVSWTTLVTAHSQCSEWEEALAIFSQMREEGFSPNQFTFSSVLVSCAGLCFLDLGRQVHSLCCKTGLDTDKCIESALLDMYAKCGNISEAAMIFKRISNPDTVSWTAIISGYAQHGLSENALQLFRRMEQLGVKPNSVTFLCVLFACSHGGLVEEGLHYFQQMKEKFGLVPEMEHYACIVDLFGRVGRLDDAMEFIRQMPIEPSEMVWQTLLGACRVHGNAELGEIAAQKVLSVRPDPATYVLLSNTYIETGSYEDGLSLREEMKEQGVKKEPGCSWISVEGRVHKFYASDQQHPQKEDIYATLEELKEKFKSMGCAPDLDIAL